MFAANLQNESGSILFALILSMFSTYLALKKGFFRLPEKEYPFSIPPRYPLLAFLLYFFASLFIGAALLLSFKSLKLSKGGLAIFQIISLYGILLIFIAFLCTIKKSIVKYIFTGDSNAPHIFVSFFKNIGFGALTWFVSYPVILFVGSLLELLSLKFLGEKGVQQVAVEQLKKTFDQPLLFLFLGFTIIFIVPFIEELLFRGFLQSYLRQKWGSNKAILFTALFFSLFHFSAKQGLGNIQLIISLFVLSWYLGFIYERQKSLWAPYGLHMTFNALSVIALKLQN